MKKVVTLTFTICAFFVVSIFANDSLGIVGGLIDSTISKFDKSGALSLIIIGFIASAIYRGAQIALQLLPTKWKWVNNKLTVGILTKIIQLLFGKTTTLYNADVDSDSMVAKSALYDTAMKHLSRNGGILQEYEKAMNELK